MSQNPFAQSQPKHVCGLYYNVFDFSRNIKTYLPQVDVSAHATILATTSRTVLTQTFVNPSTDKGIREARYVFPLYDGVSVVGFTCLVGDRTIVGEVKEKDRARADFHEAVSRGETAGLLEQLPEASDVFTTTVGNIPPSAKVIIKITYLGELKHDMEVNGIRFTIPNIICPRYGYRHSGFLQSSAIDSIAGGISITVDAEMTEGSFIQKMLSPTHPISMSMGTISSDPDAEPSINKASATLSLGTAHLDTDFVLQIVAKDTGVPKAVVETHPTIANHRALMATLVPKFTLPAERPEVVFVIDRSGSMRGNRIDLAKQALLVFLKSLPVGVKFNICSFGSRHSFLWGESVTYSQRTLDEAVSHAGTLAADMGGTEMLGPLKATIQQRYEDMSLEIVMLTDGQTWNQEASFSYLNKEITETKAPIRIFTLGIGDGVSHSLIEGLARAGNGFSQSVLDGEKMDSKIVRMLKGALSPHINDYTLEVKYSTQSSVAEEDDGFEIVEKVADSLKVKLGLAEKEKKPDTKKPISLFDLSADPDQEEPQVEDNSGESRYAHLPNVPIPKIIQAPQKIPSLFSFHRTTVYLLLGPEAPQGTPKSVVLRGTSDHGPLELEIPIQVLDTPGSTIHQLAARKAVAELEQGRGWLTEAQEEHGQLLKAKYRGRFEDIVERETVRLGVQFQVGGKWCSFIAVEKDPRKQEPRSWEWLEDSVPEPQRTGLFAGIAPASSTVTSAQLFGAPRKVLASVGPAQPGPQLQQMQIAPQATGFVGYGQEARNLPPPAFPQGRMALKSAPDAPKSAMFGSSTSSSGFGVTPPPPPPPGASASLFGSAPQNQAKPAFGTPFGGAPQNQAKPAFGASFGGAPQNQAKPAFGASASPAFGASSGASLFGAQNQSSPASGTPFGGAPQNQSNPFGSTSFGAVPPPPSSQGASLFGGASQNPSQPPSGTSLFGGAPQNQSTSSGSALFGAGPPPPSSQGASLFGGASRNSPQPSFGTSLFGGASRNSPQPSFGTSLFGGASQKQSSPASGTLFGGATPNQPSSSGSTAFEATPPGAPPSLHSILLHQTFSGAFSFSEALLASLSVALLTFQQQAALIGIKDQDVLATGVVILFLEEKMADEKDSWELVVEKARQWVEEKCQGMDGEMGKIMVAAKTLIG